MSDMPALSRPFDAPEMHKITSIVTGRSQDLDISCALISGYQNPDGESILSRTVVRCQQLLPH